MRILRSTLLLALALFSLFLTAGCKGNYDEKYWDYQHKFNDIVNLRNDLYDVGKLGKAGDSSIKIEGGSYPEENYIVFDSNLDKCISSICENYNLSAPNEEVITEEMVREALLKDIYKTANEYKEQGESYYLYKLFSWCGQPCRDNIIYCGDPQEESKEMDFLNEHKLTNYQIIVEQTYAKENNQSCTFKFKWQQ